MFDTISPLLPRGPMKRGSPQLALIVQYNTLDLDGPIGPDKLDLARDRTDETAVRSVGAIAKQGGGDLTFGSWAVPWLLPEALQAGVDEIESVPVGVANFAGLRAVELMKLKASPFLQPWGGWSVPGVTRSPATCCWRAS